MIDMKTTLSQTRIVFMGTPTIAASLLKTIIQEGFPIVALIAQPDAPVGRKKELLPVPTKEIAMKHGIPVYQPESIRKDHEFIKTFPCDLIVTLAYGQIVPDEVLNWPRRGCLNVHGSLLPALRGAAPIQYALFNGLKETGITLMGMVAKMDAGAMYAQVTVPIEPSDNHATLSDRMSRSINTHIPTLLKQYLDGKLVGMPQDETKVTFAPSVKPEQERLDVNWPLEKFSNYIRGLAPAPGAYVLDGDDKIKLLKGHKHDDSVVGPLGLVSFEDKVLLLQLRDGRYAIETLQWPSKRVMDAQAFVNGNRHVIGHLWR